MDYQNQFYFAPQTGSILYNQPPRSPYNGQVFKLPRHLLGAVKVEVDNAKRKMIEDKCEVLVYSDDFLKLIEQERLKK